MNTIKPRLFLVCLFILLSSGCLTLSKKGPLFDAAPKPINISMAKYEVTVKDKREFVDERAVKIPLAWVSYLDRVSPPLDYPECERTIESVLEQCKIAGNNVLLFEVEIIEVKQEFRGDEYSCTQYTSTILNLTVIDKHTQETLFTGEGEAWGSQEAVDSIGAQGNLEKMLRDSIRLAFIEALKKGFER